MFTILSRPYDDKEIYDVYIAEHDTKTKENFELEWQTSKEKIVEANPEYNVSEILVAMKRKGWQILHVSPVTVTY